MHVNNYIFFSLVLPMGPETVLSIFCVITFDPHNNSTEVANINLYLTGKKLRQFQKG